LPFYIRVQRHKLFIDRFIWITNLEFNL
jgi:hypothetical protein